MRDEKDADQSKVGWRLPQPGFRSSAAAKLR
jgi:hypothetical protein